MILRLSSNAQRGVLLARFLAARFISFLFQHSKRVAPTYYAGLQTAQGYERAIRSGTRRPAQLVSPGPLLAVQLGRVRRPARHSCLPLRSVVGSRFDGCLAGYCHRLRIWKVISPLHVTLFCMPRKSIHFPRRSPGDTAIFCCARGSLRPPSTEMRLAVQPIPSAPRKLSLAPSAPDPMSKPLSIASFRRSPRPTSM